MEAFVKVTATSRRSVTAALCSFQPGDNSMRPLVAILGMLLTVSGLNAAEAIAPKDGPIQLFNGKNLDGFYTWLKDTKYEDPRQVFRVTDGMLHVSGDGLGGIL